MGKISIVTIKCYDGMYFNVTEKFYFRLEKDAKIFLSEKGFFEKENCIFEKDDYYTAKIEFVKLN
jgi:hypothetical protein